MLFVFWLVSFIIVVAGIYNFIFIVPRVFKILRHTFNKLSLLNNDKSSHVEKSLTNEQYSEFVEYSLHGTAMIHSYLQSIVGSFVTLLIWLGIIACLF